MNDRVYTVMN